MSWMDDFPVEVQREELKNTLDTLLASGTVNRHNAWRFQEHYRQEQRKQREVEEDSRADPPESETPEFHAEDTRIYGCSGAKRRRIDNTKRMRDEIGTKVIEPHQWPSDYLNQTRPKLSDDVVWSLEYGDDVDDFEFAQFQRAQRPILAPQTDPRPFKGSKLDSFSAELAGTRADSSTAVFASLVHRCWNRAMLAVTSTIDASEATQSDPCQQAIELNPNDASKLCARYGLKLPDLPWMKELPCPRCCATFENLESLENHYHGTDRVRGCCWESIWEKEREGVLLVLEKECQGLLSQALDLILSRVDGNEVIDWKTIFKILQSEVESSVSVGNDGKVSSVEETLEFEKGSQPLVLNDAILRRLHERLIHRYTSIPK